MRAIKEHVEAHSKLREAGEARVGQLKPTRRSEEQSLLGVNPVPNLLRQEVPIRYPKRLVTNRQAQILNRELPLLQLSKPAIRC
jgi:hypothetical protein